MGKRLYVGSLPFSMTQNQLQDLFAPYGNVESAKVISDKATGQSKGFGFVEMSTEEEAQEAIQGLNGTSVGSRRIIVSEARPMESREPRGGGGGRPPR
jgi:RNA recognition motif-containing protein